MASRKKRKVSKRKAVQAAPVHSSEVSIPLKPAADTHHIRDWRLFRGLKTQGALAELVHLRNPQSTMTRNTICRLECGDMNYREDQLTDLALALDCSTSDLLTDPNEADIFRIYRGLSKAKRIAIREAIVAAIDKN